MKKLLTLTMTLVGLFLSTSSFATIWGPSTLCFGDTTLYMSDSVSSSGTWSSSNTMVADIAGIYAPYGVFIAAHGAGTAVITWTGVSPATVSTFTITIGALPAAIGGPTTVCAGGSVTLTSSTSGGTWTSSSPVIATISSMTGVASGLSPGICNITYTLGTGCATTRALTVTATGTDSIVGLGTICLPGSISLTSTASGTGGTWVSMTPSVATISSTGVLTGVTTGSVVISHTASTSCGIVSATKFVTVVSGVSPGTISGPTTVAVGSSITLSSSVGAGTWSNSCPSIATIHPSTGVVTGVSGGTCVMTYTVGSSCGTMSSVYTITVLATDCISGNVKFTGAPYIGNVKVWLIKYNPSTSMLTAVDSQSSYCPDTVVPYIFCGLSTDSFRVKASRSYVPAGTGYLPTYHTSSAHWSTATVIPHVSGTSDVNKDIIMGYGTGSAGPGFIGGNVTTGANKGTADGAPVVGLLVYCINTATGAILQSAYTDATGHYFFSNLPVGEPLKIYPELMNYVTTPYPTVTFSGSYTSLTAANFIQHTIGHTITPVPVAVVSVANAGTSISVFPNPASSTLNVKWNAANAGAGTVVIADITGRVVLTNTIDMTNLSGTAPLNIAGIGAGIYMVTIKANGVNYNAKVAIQ